MDKEQNFEGVKGFSLGSFAVSWEQRKLGELTSLITKGTTPLDKSNIGLNPELPLTNIILKERHTYGIVFKTL